MTSSLVQKAQLLLPVVIAQGQEYLSQLPALRQAIIAQYGEVGFAAIAVVALALVSLIAYKVVSFGLKVLKYLVVPAVALALIGSIILPYSFLTILPVTAAACSVLLFFKA